MLIDASRSNRHSTADKRFPVDVIEHIVDRQTGCEVIGAIFVYQDGRHPPVYNRSRASLSI